MIVLVIVALVLAIVPTVVYLRNVRLFRPPPIATETTQSRPEVSVLIPARNEEGSIAACLESVLASTGVTIEVVVLDDHSTDSTAAIVTAIAGRDSRVRIETAPPLPADWCGKQHACFVLSKLARYDTLTFLDADVRLTPDAISRMVEFQRSSRADLVSGFPRQETGTLLEKLVIPLINWLLLCYLPMARMRASLQPGLGAGCGQWFLTSRSVYEKIGGHSAVRHSLHDGVTLPRAYRRNGFRTDICDATDLAVCRMYRRAGQVWFGLAKNAREGLGSWPLILIWTTLLAGGHVLPWLLILIGLDLAYDGAVARSLLIPSDQLRKEGWNLTVLASVAAGLSLLVRLDSARRFRASFLGAVFHPLGMTALLAIQWYATVRAWVGKPVGWKGRAYPSLSST